VSRPALSLLAVVAALAAGTAGAALVQPADSGAAAAVAAPASVPVRSALAVCPGVPTTDPGPAGGAAGTGSTTVTTLTPSAPAGAAPSTGPGTGEGALGEVAELGTKVARASLLRPGALVETDAPPDRPAVVARASGSLAPGLTVTQTTESRSGLGRGLAATACTPPGTSQWFIGTGAQLGERSRLVLTDADLAPAQLDVSLYGPGGPLHPAGGRDLSVAAGGRRVVALEALAPGQRVLAVHVTVRAGRVSAALQDERVRGATGEGSDFLPAAAAPAPSLVLPGVPAGGGTRTLVLMAPGRAGASVQLQLVGADGTFTPAGVKQVDLDPGVVRTVDLGQAAAGEALGVRVEADRPVLAGLQVTRSGARTDTGFLAAVPPLTGPAVVTDAVAGPGRETRISLTAPLGAVAVDVATVTAAGAGPTPRQVLVGAGRTVSLVVPAPAPTGRYAVVVTPREGSGPVYAARMLTLVTGDGPLFTTAPLQDRARTVSAPVVTRDPS